MSTTTIVTTLPNESYKGQTAFTIVEALFLAIATLLVSLRVYVRTMIVRGYGLDDTFMVLALVSAVVINRVTN